MTYAFINQFFAFTPVFQRCLLLQIIVLNLHLHLHISCYSMRLASLVPDTKLNTLTFKFLTTSRTRNFVHGLLISLQLPKRRG